MPELLQLVCPPPVLSRGVSAVRVGIGLFLLITAGLKLHGLGLDPLASESFLSSPRLQIAAIELEVLLGVLLIASLWTASSRARAISWIAVVFFGILACISLYQALDGQASCGCFGQLEVSPWWTFGLDVGILILLVASRQQTSPLAPLGERGGGEGVLPSLFRPILGATAILAVIACSFFLWFENPQAALAQLRGETIAVDPVVSDVGHAPAGEAGDFQIELTNHSAHAVRIVGGTTSCACIATNDLPVTLEPNGSATIGVRMKFSGTPGRFQHKFILYTDDQAQPVIVARFAGRVTAARAP